MSRKARLNVPGVTFHVMARGIEGRDIFTDDEDRVRFLGFLSARLAESGYRCYAWALVVNHYHLLVRSSEHPLAMVMKPLNAEYARYFNRKYDRRGYLFQDRYKSIATQDQNYLKELVAYIHLNPVRSGLCKSMRELDRYPWSGHSALTGIVPRNFQDTAAVLKRFGISVEEARKRYAGFINDKASSTGDDPRLAEVRKNNAGAADRYSPGSWVIGDAEFVKRVLAGDSEKKAALARYAREGVSIEDLADRICAQFGLQPEMLTMSSKRTALARARMVFCYLGTKLYGFRSSQIADYLGITQGAATNAARKGFLMVKKDNLII